MNQIPESSLPSYSCCERIVRTAVFQVGVAAGFLESIIIRIFSMIAQGTFFPKLFDHERAEKGLQSLIKLGAEVEFVTPKDGLAKIQMLTLRSDAFEKKLISLGARWEKITLLTDTVFAIIPPQTRTPEWVEIENAMLKLNWKVRSFPRDEINSNITFEQENVDLIITSDVAKAVPESECHQNLFMHSNSAGVSFIMLMYRLACYFGNKQNVCFYDPRGTWKSQGVASEGGYYNDIEAVYKRVTQLGFSPDKIKITAACGGCSAALHLKTLIHNTDTTFVLENGFLNMRRDFLERENCISRWIANRYWHALSDSRLKGTTPENGFDLETRLKDLGCSDIGKIIIVRVKNDELLSEDVRERNLALAKRINKNVFEVCFHSDNEKISPHSARWYKLKKVAFEGISLILNR